MSGLVSHKKAVVFICKWLMRNYWGPLNKRIQQEPDLLDTFPGFILNPERIIFYFGRTHIALEYMGPERLTELKSNFQNMAQFFAYTAKECNLLEQIIGFEYGSEKLSLPLSTFTYDLLLPTNAGADELQRVNWNWDAQEHLVGFNAGCPIIPKGEFARLINARFFDANENGLKTRHIKWIDFIPTDYLDIDDESERFRPLLEPYAKMVEIDLRVTYPTTDDFKYERLQKLNRFIELFADSSNHEPAITNMLSQKEYEFILKMRFAAKAVHSQKLCVWQSEEKSAIQPDFFIERPDGFADIIEFKLPILKRSSVVGQSNREVFSAEINSYIAQTRVYLEYFEDPRNRKYVSATYGFNVRYPKRFLVMGRRWNFKSDEWRAITSEYPDLQIISYDDLVDGVRMQFY